MTTTRKVAIAFLSIGVWSTTARSADEPAPDTSVAPATAEAFVEASAITAEEAAAITAEEAAAAASDGKSPPQAIASTSVDSDAVMTIAGLNDSLLAVLKQANESNYAQRFAMLEPSLKKHFDLEYMARQVVGRAFLDLSEEDRIRWYDLFATYMTTNYASRFDHYSQQRFEILGEEDGAKDTVLVRTRVIDPADENVDLSYRLRQIDGNWRVVDVYLKGTVSELALRRSEYSSVLKREGFGALSEKIQSRIKEIEAGDVEG